MDAFGALPVEVVERVLGYLGGSDLARVAMSCKNFALSAERCWRSVLQREFRMTWARLSAEEAIGARAIYCHLRRLVRQVDETARQGWLAQDAAVLGSADTFAHADRCEFLLQTRPLACGMVYALHTIRKAAVFRFVAREMARINADESATSEYGAALIAFCSSDPHEDVPVMVEARLAELAASCPPVDRNDPVAATRIILKHLRDVPIKSASPETYYSESNSYLHRVLAPGGSAIPITFAVALQAVARRLGVAIDLLNTRGHLICHIHGTEMFVDAFMGRIEPFHVLATLYGFADSEEEAVCRPRDIWLRMLRNLWQLVSHPATLVVMMASLTSMPVDRAARVPAAEHAWRNEHMARLGFAEIPFVAEPPKSPPQFERRVKVGHFVLLKPLYRRAVCVGYNGPGVALVVVEGEQREEEVGERNIVLLDGAQDEPLRSTLTGKYFIRFENENGRYVPNPITHRLYAADFEYTDFA